MIDMEQILIDAVHSKEESISYLKNNIGEEFVFIEILEIVEDEEQCDARIGGAYWISQFDKEILVKYEDRLLDLLNVNIDSVVVHIMMGLAKIKSKRGIQTIVEKRILPVLYWEGKALEEYFSKKE